jgi:hypothetical protein
MIQILGAHGSRFSFEVKETVIILIAPGWSRFVLRWQAVGFMQVFRGAKRAVAPMASSSAPPLVVIILILL